MKNSLPLLLAGVLIVTGLFAQQNQYHFELFSLREGLCHNRLTSLCQDRDGFLWIGTEKGLSRFDGSLFKNYFPKAGDSTTISSESVIGIHQNMTGPLWINTTNGINLYDALTGKFNSFLRYPAYFQHLHEASDTRHFIRDSRIWFVKSNNDFGFIDYTTGQTGTLPFQPTAKNKDPIIVGDILARGENQLWLATSEGLGLFDLQHASFRRFEGQEALSAIALLQDNQNGVYYATWHGGLFYFNINNASTLNWTLENGANLPNIIHALLRLSDDEWWLGTEGGLYRLNPQTGINQRIPLPNETDYPLVIKDLLLDNKGIIWVATEHGLLKLDPHLQGFNYTKVVSDPSPIYENQIYQVAVSQNPDRTFVVSRGGHLFVLNENNEGVQDIPIFKNFNAEPTMLFKSGANQWYLNTRANVYRFDPETFFTEPLTLPPRRAGRKGLFWVSGEDHLGRIWFGLSRDGILIHDPNLGENFYLTCEENNFCAFNVWDIQLDPVNRKVWVGTDWNGLWEGDLDNLKFRQINQKNTVNLPSDQVLSLEQDRTGTLWIGTPLGLCRYDWNRANGDAFSCYSEDDGLPLGFVEGLTLDKQGFLWGGSVDKLVRIDPQTLDIDIFDHHFGVDFTSYPISNISLGPDGKMYAGGKKGFLSWNPSSFQKDTIEPRLFLTGLRVLGKSFEGVTNPEKLKTLRLKHFQNSFTFDFSALDFTLPERNHFAWKLEGFDKNWRKNVQGRSAVYSRIPPGNYTFKLRNSSSVSSDGNDLDSQSGLNIEVVIMPSFWQTLWFKVLAVIALFAGLYFWNRQRIKLIKEKEALKTAFQKRIAELEMTALRAQMKPHFVFNCLNSINRFIQLSDADTASDYLTKFSRLIRLVLDNSKGETVPLDREIQALQLYLELEGLRFSGRFQYEFQVDEQLELSGIDIPPLLIQPFIENGIWHGLMHKEGNDGFLRVAFSQEDDYLKIVISDNGIGRHASAALKSKSATRHKSYGMEMTYERLNYIRQLFQKDISIEVEDLVGPEGKPAGTEVTLRIEID